MIAGYAVDVMVEREAENDVELPELGPLGAEIEIGELATIPSFRSIADHQIHVACTPDESTSINSQCPSGSPVRRKLAERSMIAPHIENGFPGQILRDWDGPELVGHPLCGLVVASGVDHHPNTEAR